MIRTSFPSIQSKMKQARQNTVRDHRFNGDFLFIFIFARFSRPAVQCFDIPQKQKFIAIARTSHGQFIF